VLDPQVCYKALQTRDERFDGRIFVGVTSTGIYCRPVCPARPAKLANCRFFPTAAAAQEAGFRPCLRCRPETALDLGSWRGTSNTVSRGLALIADGDLDGDDACIDSLAERLGVGGRQLRRLFQQHLGASPIAVAQTRRVLFAKQLIHETRLPMSEIALAAGFGSVRRFNEVFRALYQRPPSALRGKRESSVPESIAGSGVTVRLRYRAPYDWAAMLSYLRARAIDGVERVDGSAEGGTARTPNVDGSAEGGAARTPNVDGSAEGGTARTPNVDGSAEGTARTPNVDGKRYARTVVQDGETGTVTIAHLPAAMSLAATIRFPSVRALPAIVARIRRLFDLGADVAAIDAHLAKDTLLAPMIARRPGLRAPGAWDGFELAARAILGQQVTVEAGRQLASKLVRLRGSVARATDTGDPSLTLTFPSAKDIASADLSTIGMPNARRQALVALAKAAAADPHFFEPQNTLDETVARLRTITGIGDWTAHYIALRAMREPDAFPSTDVALLGAAAVERGTRPSPSELLERAERWRPWRAYAAQHLWTRGLS
jgi:AraC family transcriptional regulator of adaptative response / DNA-3-methyladenine glycosylase II